MNVGIILDYFKFFVPFSHQKTLHRYCFTTTRNRFRNAHVSVLDYCNPNNARTFHGQSSKGDWRHYFKTAIKLGSLQPTSSAETLAVLYENHFEHFISDHHIDLLIAGGTTGFERCGLATSQRVGIKTLCMWEGFFRPNTITYDRKGMNAESEFCSVPFKTMRSHIPSKKFKQFFPEDVNQLKSGALNPSSLRRIQGERFNVLKQARNRWVDRTDVERIRLPLWQHLIARASYVRHKGSYRSIEKISNPFIFFPLQTHTDTNVALNCDVFPFSEIAKRVVTAFSNIQKELRIELIIKEHPMDVFRIDYDRRKVDGVSWISPETPTAAILLNPNCIGTVVVNSTAGLESLILGRPVLTLGRSLYGRAELVDQVTNPSLEEISRHLLQLPSRRVNGEALQCFLSFLYDEAQLEGNLDVLPTASESD